MDIINSNGFVKSDFIKVYPNAYRGKVEKGQGLLPIPFDPESKLNTEKNYRNTSSITGKKSFMMTTGSTTYYDPNSTSGSTYKHVKFCLYGYQFEIFCLDSDYQELTQTNSDGSPKQSPNYYYAMLKIDSTRELFGNYRTEVLDNLFSGGSNDYLDISIKGEYYFCGLKIEQGSYDSLYGYDAEKQYYYLRIMSETLTIDPANIYSDKQKLFATISAPDIDFTDGTLNFTGATIANGVFKNSVLTEVSKIYGVDAGGFELSYKSNIRGKYTTLKNNTIALKSEGGNVQSELVLNEDSIIANIGTKQSLGIKADEIDINISKINSKTNSGLSIQTETESCLKLNNAEIKNGYFDLNDYKLTGTNNTVNIINNLNVAKNITATTINTKELITSVTQNDRTVKFNTESAVDVQGGPYVRLTGTDKDYTPFDLRIGYNGASGEYAQNYARLSSNFCNSNVKFEQSTLTISNTNIIGNITGDINFGKVNINFSEANYIIGKTRYIKATAANNIIDTILDKTNFINDTSVNILDITLETSTDISSLFNISTTSTFSKFNETGAGNKKIIVRFESTTKIDISFYNPTTRNNSTLVRNKGYFMFEIYPWKKVGYSSAASYFSIYTLQIRVTKTNTGDYYFTNVTRTIASDGTAITRLIALGYSFAFAKGTPIVTILDEPEIVCADRSTLSCFTTGNSNTTFAHTILENSTAGATTFVEKVLPESFDKLCIYGYGKINPTTNFVKQAIYSPNFNFEELRVAYTAFSVSTDINITPSQAETYFPFKFEISYSDLNAFKGSIDTGKAGKYQCFTSYSDFDGSTNMILELVYLNQCSEADTNYKTLALHIWEQAGMSLQSYYGEMPRIQITKLLITVK